MSARKRTTRPNNSPPTPPSPGTTATNLPPPRPRTKPTVRAPLSSTGLPRLIYTLVVLSLLLAAYYSWRAYQWKSAAGGWWNLALGRRPPQLETKVESGSNSWGGNHGSWDGWKQKEGSDDVEDKIVELAAALGVPAPELASAIAGAVREYVPPASLSSVAAQAEKTGGGVVEELVGQKEDGGVVGEVVSGIGSVVGFDEPPEQV